MNNPKTKRRRKIQFGLRSLLALMLVAGVGTGWFVSRIREVQSQDKIAEKLSLEVGVQLNAIPKKRSIVEMLVGRKLYPDSYFIRAPIDRMEIVTSEASKLKHVWELEVDLDFPGKQKDLSFATNFPDLQTLTVTNCQKLESIEGIEALQNLKRLDIFFEYRSNIGFSMKPLRSLQNLEMFAVGGAGDMRDIEVLGQLPHLESLTLATSNPWSFQLSNRDELRELYIHSATTFEDVDFIGSMHSLRKLTIEGNYLGSVPKSDVLKNLDELNIIDCESLVGNSASAKNVTVTGGTMQNLQGVVAFNGASSIEFREVLFRDISGLGKLKNVSQIYLSNCLLKRMPLRSANPKIKELQQSLPNTTIIVGPRTHKNSP